MVNRKNYLKVRIYMEYLEEVRQLSSRSLGRYWTYLKHLLLWADEATLHQVPIIRPTFSTYLKTARMDGKGKILARTTTQKIVQNTKRFFTWLLLTYPTEFCAFPRTWIHDLRPPTMPDASRERQFVTLDQVLELIALDSSSSLPLQRNQAAAAMLFLSGMRSGAFCSLPIEAVNLSEEAIKQWPALGVKTKNGKKATTYLLDIPELREVVEKWDAFVRAELPPSAAWYAPFANRWGVKTLSHKPPGVRRDRTLYKQIIKLFSVASIPYLSPHKFRHGYAVFSLQHARTMADYKATSTNLMHGHINITDEIYAPLAQDEVRRRVTNLTKRASFNREVDDDLREFLQSLSDAQFSQVLLVAAERLAR